MSNDKSFDEFYAKLNDIVNSAYNLGEIYNQPKIVRKILRSLTGLRAIDLDLLVLGKSKS